jgi:DNA-binding response OmpR family regulator
MALIIGDRSVMRDFAASSLRLIMSEIPDLLVILSDAPLEDVASEVTYWRTELDTQAIMVALRAYSPAVVDVLSNAGADEVLRLPCESAELVARARLAARRRLRSPVPGVVLDYRDRLLSIGATIVALTEREFAIVDYLARNCGRWTPAAELLNQAFGAHHRSDSSVVRTHVASIRAKLGPLAGRLCSRPRFGYMLSMEDQGSIRWAGGHPHTC